MGTATARTWRGEDSEAFEWVLVDLAPYAGQSARLRLYDSAAGAWGHLMLDHVVLMRP